MSRAPTSRDCEHGELARSCRICELERDIAAEQEARQAAEALAESYRKDAERLEFLHERCSVTFTFKRNDGTSAMIAGATNLRAAIDAAIAAKGVDK